MNSIGAYAAVGPYLIGAAPDSSFRGRDKGSVMTVPVSFTGVSLLRPIKLLLLPERSRINTKRPNMMGCEMILKF